MKQLVKKLDLLKGYPEKCFKSSRWKKPVAEVSLNLGTNDTLDSNDSRITLVTTVEQHSLMILRRLCFKF